MLSSTSIEAGGIELRPAGPGDEGRIQAFVGGLTPRTRYLRFFNGFARAEAYTEFTLLAIVPLTEDVVGMAQYCDDPGRGIGRRLVCRLLDVARESGLRRMEAEVLWENARALQLLKRLGFELRRDAASALLVRGSLVLAS